MKKTLCVAFVMLAWSAGVSEAQDSARNRAQRELPSAIFEGIAALAAGPDNQGVPSEPLFNKALEGLAKRVPTNRLLPAIQMYAGRLRDSRAAFGMTAEVPLIVAGADALQRGVPHETLRRLGADDRRSPVSVLVLADLLDTGMATDRALAMLREAHMQRTREDRMLDMPAQIRRLMRDGRSMRDAADQVRRGLMRGRGNGNMGPPVPPGSEPVTRDRMDDMRGRRRGG